MLNNMPALTHEQQQLAVERIQALMAAGMSSGAALAQVARELRAGHTGERVTLRWEEENPEVLETTAARAEKDPYHNNPDDD